MYNYHIQQTDISQPESRQKLDRSLYTPYQWNTLDPQPSENALGEITALAKSDPIGIYVLNRFLILKFQGKHKHLFPSQGNYLKGTLDCADSTISRKTSWLDKKGYVVKKSRGANKSCEYKVSSWFNNPWIQEELKTVIPIFYFTTISLLSIQSLEKKPCIRSINVFNFIKKHTIQTGTVNTTTGRKEEYQKRILKKKGRTMLEEIKSELNLGEYETSQLSKFSEVVLKEAFDSYKKKDSVTNPFRYFLGACNNIAARKQPVSAKGKEHEYKKKPATELSQEKLQELAEYYGVVELDKKVKRFEKCMSLAKQTYEKYPTIENQKWIEDYELGLQRWIKIFNFAIELDIRKANESEQPNTHQDKNLLTNSNVVRVANVENSELDYNQLEESFDDMVIKDEIHNIG